MALVGVPGKPKGPIRCARLPKPYKAYNRRQSSILTILTSFLWILASENFSGTSRNLAGSVFNFNSQLQSSVLHLRLVSIFSFFLFFANMLLGKHASIYFYFFGIFAYIYLSFMRWWCWKIYRFTYLSSIVELTYVGCYENTWKSVKTK